MIGLAGIAKGVLDALIGGFVSWWWNPMRQAIGKGKLMERLEHAKERMNESAKRRRGRRDREREQREWMHDAAERDKERRRK